MFARGTFSSHFEPFKSCTECHRHNELNRRVAKKLLLGFYVPQKPAGGEHNNMRLEGFIRLITFEQCITILENKPRKPKESLTRTTLAKSHKHETELRFAQTIGLAQSDAAGSKLLSASAM